MNNKIQFIFAVAGIFSLLYLLMYGSWAWILVSFVYYKLIVGLIGNQIAQHRYYSHQSFRTSRFKHWLLYFFSLTTGINPVWYALAHRHHHVWSDTDNDVHSPLNGWKDTLSPIVGLSREIKNIEISRVLSENQRKINRYWYLFFIAYVLIFFVINYKLAVFLALAGVGWNYLHMIVFRVWLAHWRILGSYRNFETNDQSYNHQWIHYFDIGEGLHNNHHRYPNRYDQAVKPGEFDLAGIVVRKFFI
jgi:stearoyl-CoA desaturase (delta-9 desaturase)